MDRLLPGADQCPAPQPRNILDAHHHFWDRGTGHYPWLSEANDFFLGDYAVLRQGNLTLPLFRVVLSPTITRPFYAVPRTSVARTASG